MKIKDSGTPSNLRDYVILSVSLSLVAILIVCIEFKIQLSEVSRELAYNKLITLAGLIIGILGVAATVYFVIMGIDIHQYKREMDDILKNQKKTNAKIVENKFNILDALSMMEGLADDEQKKGVIRLAMGRIISKSEIHTEDYPLETGISYLGQYSSSQEDIDILQGIEKEKDDEIIRKQAKKAREEIEKRRERRRK